MTDDMPMNPDGTVILKRRPNCPMCGQIKDAEYKLTRITVEIERRIKHTNNTMQELYGLRQFIKDLNK